MRSTVKRTIAVTALGFPLLLGAPAVALADDGGSTKPSHSQPLQNLEQTQGAENETEQGNSNESPVNQYNIGGHGDQSAATFTEQANDNATAQEQGQDGEQESEEGEDDGKGKN